MITADIIHWLQGALNPKGIEDFARRNNISGLPIGKIASLFAAQILQQEYGLNFPGGTEAIAAYLRNDYEGFVSGNPEAIADELNKEPMHFKILGMDFFFGGQTFDWKVLAGIGLAGVLAYKFFKA